MSFRFVVLALVLVPSLSAQQPAVDSLIRAEMARKLIPGMALAVIRDGAVVKAAGYGLASVELGVPATAATLFQIASATKNVTGVAVMQLVGAGKIRLDDPIGAHLTGLPERWRPVTIRQLASHTSGLPDVVLDSETGAFMPGPLDSVLMRLAAMPVEPAGTKWSYNQTNYLLLGMLVEKHTGLSFPAYANERIFKPAGITGAVFGDSRPIIAQRTTEYTRLRVSNPKRIGDLRTFSYEYPSWLFTAAGIFLSADDAARWLLALDGDKLIPRSAFREMTTTVTLDGRPFHFQGEPMGYGIGWITIDTPTHRAVGGSGGGRAVILYYPEERLGVAVLTNLQGAGPEELADRVAKLYLGNR